VIPYGTCVPVAVRRLQTAILHFTLLYFKHVTDMQQNEALTLGSQRSRMLRRHASHDQFQLAISFP